MDEEKVVLAARNSSKYENMAGLEVKREIPYVIYASKMPPGGHVFVPILGQF